MKKFIVIAVGILSVIIIVHASRSGVEPVKANVVRFEKTINSLDDELIRNFFAGTGKSETVYKWQIRGSNVEKFDADKYLSDHPGDAIAELVVGRKIFIVFTNDVDQKYFR